MSWSYLMNWSYWRSLKNLMVDRTGFGFRRNYIEKGTYKWATD
jgi:hypothetical protein